MQIFVAQSNHLRVEQTFRLFSYQLTGQKVISVDCSGIQTIQQYVKTVKEEYGKLLDDCLDYYQNIPERVIRQGYELLQQQ